MAREKEVAPKIQGEPRVALPRTSQNKLRLV